MAMNIGSVGRAKVRPVMNVTPLVDVVLVVLIIFMVITPLLGKQFSLQVPPKDEVETPPPPADAPPPIVLTIDGKGALALNSEKIDAKDAPDRLRRALAARRDPVLFFDASDDAPYGAAMDALDMARSAGATTIAVLPDKISP